MVNFFIDFRESPTYPGSHVAIKLLRYWIAKSSQLMLTLCGIRILETGQRTPFYKPLVYMRELCLFSVLYENAMNCKESNLIYTKGRAFGHEACWWNEILKFVEPLEKNQECVISLSRRFDFWERVIETHCSC